MSKLIELSANVADSLALVTKHSTQSISIVLPTSTDLGGGTLSFGVRPARSAGTIEEVDNLIAGQKNNYLVGSQMEVYLTLSGATDPAVEVFISEL